MEGVITCYAGVSGSKQIPCNYKIDKIDKRIAEARTEEIQLSNSISYCMAGNLTPISKDNYNFNVLM